jgi:hypothetical protein
MPTAGALLVHHYKERSLRRELGTTVVNPGMYRPKRQTAPVPEVKASQAPARPEIFTAEYVQQHPEMAAAALNACYYDLVDLEKNKR